MPSSSTSSPPPANPKTRLEHGIAGLQAALQNCILNPEEKKVLQRALTANLEALNRIAPKMELNTGKPTLPVLGRKVTAAGTQEIPPHLLKKAVKQEIERLQNLAGARRQATIAETNKKSRLSSFIVRVPGSFESSKKR